MKMELYVQLKDDLCEFKHAKEEAHEKLKKNEK
jgi:hypothetical protein